MSAGWVRVEPAVAAAGHVGGDTQVGEAWSARWIRELPDGTWGVVDRIFYVACVDEPHMYLQCQSVYLICTNPGDPGSSEIWSDARYDTEPGDPTDYNARLSAQHAAGPSNSEWVAVIPWAETA